MRSLAFVSFPLLRVGRKISAPEGLRSPPNSTLPSEPAIVARYAPLVGHQISSLQAAPDLYSLSDSTRDVLVHGFDAVRADFSRLMSAVDDTTDAINAMAAVLSADLGRLTRATEQQTAILEKVSELISKPLDTASRERRERGIRAYRAGLLEESEADLAIAVEQNVYDHISWLLLGHIHLRQGELDRSLSSYERSIRYSSVEDVAVVEGFAWLGKSRVLQEMGAIADAAEAAGSADRMLSQARWDVPYEVARTAAQRGDLEAAAEALSRALVCAPVAVTSLCLAEPFLMPIQDASQVVAVEAYSVTQRISSIASIKCPPAAGTLSAQLYGNMKLIDDIWANLEERKEADLRRVREADAEQYAELAEEQEQLQEDYDNAALAYKRRQARAKWRFPAAIGAFFAWRYLVIPLLEPAGGPIDLGGYDATVAIGSIGYLAAPILVYMFLNKPSPDFMRKRSVPPMPAPSPTPIDTSIDTTKSKIDSIAAEPLAGAELRIHELPGIS